jgi:hypothetical protein
MRTRRFGFLVAFALAFAGQTWAGSPRDELLRLVPEDVGFCLVLEDLRGHTAQLLESRLARQLQKSPMAAVLDSDRDWRQFTQVQKQLEALLGIDWPKLRDDILGDAIVVAYRPGPPDKPHQEQALILLRARDPQALAQLVERVNQFQKASGEVKAVEPREDQGRRYFERVQAKGAEFYALDGPTLMVASQETMLREALARHSKAAAAETGIDRQLQLLLGSERRLVSLWINPRAFDVAIAARAREARGEQAAVARNFQTYWQALDGVALALGIRDEVTCELAVRGRPERLSPAARRFLAEAARPSELWRRVPPDALLAVAGRFDFSAFEEVLGEFLTPQTRKTLHDTLDRFLGAALDKDVVKEVLPCLGPDFGCCLLAPQDSQASWAPQGWLALRVRPGERAPFIDQALYSALGFFAQAAVIDHNSKHPDRMSLKTAPHGKVEVKHLLAPQFFPPGIRPAFALKDGYLVLASSPEMVDRFAASGSVTDTDDTPLLRLSLKELRRFLQAHQKSLAAVLAQQHHSKVEEEEKQFDGLAHALQLLDSIEITRRTQANQFTLTFRVRLAQSLGK